MQGLRQTEEQARAKINLSLDVLRRRPDGYHEVRMIMQSLALCDDVVLTRIPESEAKGRPIQLQITEARGQAAGSVSELPADAGNLMWRAAALLREHCGVAEGVSMQLTKRIPVAAGLAGGSTDAAAVLRGMNRLFALGLSAKQLAELGLQLGADVPYCLQGGTMLAEGIGEQLSALPPAPACQVLLVKPKRGVSTGAVYGALHVDALPKVAHPDVDRVIEALAAGDFAALCGGLGNVLEPVTCRQVPEIGEIETFLRESGAEGVRMSGSGPTVFALVSDAKKQHTAAENIRRSALAPLLSDVIETRFA